MWNSFFLYILFWSKSTDARVFVNFVLDIQRKKIICRLVWDEHLNHFEQRLSNTFLFFFNLYVQIIKWWLQFQFCADLQTHISEFKVENNWKLFITLTQLKSEGRVFRTTGWENPQIEVTPINALVTRASQLDEKQWNEAKHMTRRDTKIRELQSGSVVLEEWAGAMWRVGCVNLLLSVRDCFICAAFRWGK